MKNIRDFWVGQRESDNELTIETIKIVSYLSSTVKYSYLSSAFDIWRIRRYYEVFCNYSSILSNVLSAIIRFFQFKNNIPFIINISVNWIQEKPSKRKLWCLKAYLPV